MPLTVGELTALVSVDDDGMSAGLDSAERQVRSAGRDIGRAAERAGENAGEQLGEGITRGADGRLRDARGRFVRAGREAGQGFAEGASEGSADAGGEIGGSLKGMKGGLAGIAAGIGAAVGAALIAGMTEALNQSRIVGKLGAQLGATPAEAKKYGELAGDLYADAITEDFQGAADAISATMRSGLLPPEATNKQIKSIATKVSDLASTFELDLGQAANAVGQMMKTGLAPNAEAALDTITKGLQEMGPRADDILDTFNEYSTQFRELGLSAKEATGIMSQGLKAGARDTDVVADSLKEFVLIAQGGGKDVQAAFAAIGLNGAEMQRVFTKGGPQAKEALDKVFDGLRGVGNESERQALALTLFGTKSEDMQDALMAIDPSSAVESLGKVGGAADKMGTTLRDNAGTKVEQFKRTMTQGFVEFLGGEVIPALEEFAEKFGPIFEKVGRKISEFWTEAKPLIEEFGAVVQEVITLVKKVWDEHGKELLGILRTTWEMIKGVVKGALRIIKGIIQVVTGIISGDWAKVWQGVKNIVGGAWDAIMALVKGALSLIWQYVKMAAGIIWGLIKDGWNKAVQTTKDLWNGMVAYFKSIPYRIAANIISLTSKVIGIAIDAGQGFRRWIVRKFMDSVRWVRGLPGRLISAIGSVNNLLYEKGKDIARGLLQGIKSMGSWIASQLSSWAASIVPGPIASALGIASPSRVMADQVGRWIPAGIVQGIERGQGALDTAMSNLVQPPAVPRMQLAGPGMAGAMGGTFGMAPDSGGARVHIDSWHAADNGTPEQNAQALAWAAKARG